MFDFKDVELIKDLNGNVYYENQMATDFLGLSDSDNANKWNYEEKRADEISNEDNEIIKNLSSTLSIFHSS